MVKSSRRRRLVGVKHRVVFGTWQRVEHVLSACGWKINTAFVERLHWDIRQRVAAVGRRVNTLCQGADGVPHQLVLFQRSHHGVLPHASVRQPLLVPEPANGSGSAKVWRPCTPAMAAGLTDHVWSLREVLLFRVPPWPQAQTVSATGAGEERGVERLKCAQMQPHRAGRGREHPFRVRMTG